MKSKLTFKIFKSIDDVPQIFFNTRELFNSYDYYYSLEHSGSLSKKNSWLPYYFVFTQDYKQWLLPCFVRHDSRDDFCYDHLYYESYKNKIQKKYYPKLQVCTPFMPIAGSNFIGDMNSQEKTASIQILQKWCQHNNLNSIHISLPNMNEYNNLTQLGFLSSQQHLCYWYNKSYKHFDDFLKKLKSKYRSQIKKERAHILQQKYSTEIVQGEKLSQKHIKIFYDLFQYTHDRKLRNRSKLSLDFFLHLLRKNPSNMTLIFIKKSNQAVAASCLFMQGSMLCGRFWGSLYDKDYLHFEVMYYLPIQYCIEHTIEKMEIGFVKHHKIIRGFEPKQVHSFHHFFDENMPEYSHDLNKKIYTSIYTKN